MVAPNGARLTKADHPAMPITIADVIACAVACQSAGADGLHAHLRDTAGQHLLDAGRYREMLVDLHQRLPGFYVQITTEAVGRYSPEQQRTLVQDLRPRHVSIALREITDGQDDATTKRFFAFCTEADIGVQHILYDEADAKHLAHLVARGDIAGDRVQALLVLGRYVADQTSTPAEVTGFVQRYTALVAQSDWAVCAFGRHETACLAEAIRLGGKARIGFENNRLNADGSIAADNTERVSELVARLAEQPQTQTQTQTKETRT
jgi:uncharacterized protein (DUF849 family)